jgi:hypothetical protein
VDGIEIGDAVFMGFSLECATVLDLVHAFYLGSIIGFFIL